MTSVIGAGTCRHCGLPIVKISGGGSVWWEHKTSHLAACANGRGLADPR